MLTNADFNASMCLQMWGKQNLNHIGEIRTLKFRAAGTFTADVTDCFTTSPVEDRKTFFREILDFGSLDAKKFPELCASSDIVGHVTESSSKELGLCAGIPVFGGCDDIAGLAIGVGSCSLGQAHVYLGTSGWLSYVIPADAHSVTNAPLDNRNDIFFLGLGASIGPSTTWTLRALFPEYTDMQELDAAVLREFIDRIEVSHADKNSKTREITIVYNFIGAFDFTRAIEEARNTTEKQQKTA